MAKHPATATGVPPRKTLNCRHCGSPLNDAAMLSSGFCCSGCAYVYRIVHEHGLDGYYRIKDDITPPVDTAVFHVRDFSWLKDLQQTAETQAGEGTPVAVLGLQGISCAGCVWLIERFYQQLPGARQINVNAQLGEMELRWTKGEFSLEDFARKLHAFNYLVGPHDAEAAEPESRGLVRRIGLCSAFALNVMLFTLPTYFGMESNFAYARIFGTLSLVFGTLSLFAGGGYFFQRAWQGLRVGLLHIDLPISLGILGAYLGSLYGWFSGHEAYVYFDFVSGFVVLMLVGRWAQVVAVERNRRRLLAQQPRPQNVSVVQSDGTLLAVAPDALVIGQTFVIRPGQIIPVEAKLSLADATFSLASISGEATPRIYQPGQRVPAGAVNIGRAEVRLIAQQVWADSLLAQLTRPREQAGSRHVFLDRIIQGYLIGILLIAAGAGLGWGMLTGDFLRTGAIVTAILVVSCPCAIGLAFPLAEEMASVALRRRGVYVRESGLWAKLGRVRQLIFDKTGTLTLETPVLANPESLTILSPEARQALFTLVRDTAHPISQCLFENLLAAGPTPQTLPGQVRETVGQGIELGPWSLGRSGWKCALSPEPGTVLVHEGSVVARFEIHDTVRPDVTAELAALAARGLSLHILSGDQGEKVQALVQSLGLPALHGHGGMTPQDKADWLKQADQRDTLMLGDGANDSLAFDSAFCRGTPVIHRGILEQKADFYYLGQGIGGIRALFEINAIRRRTEFAILVFSVLYNLIAVGLAVAGLINPLVAAVLMPANSLLTLAVVTIGMKPAFVRPWHKKTPLAGQGGFKVVVGPGFEPGKA
ncbi:MAG: heavy metal translocating P-type ATPase metal-binding domain-containing protein [Cephaloticoccus sp.]|nr:heavy metal translocating P-type ATPase metal-binding domain-containing protein [Cephaloticoccus sp.]MCF7760908.1 heavy metal translocating P-type ATPase metal-binding domain-containing protein [Cephaloticoccus sp.]